jgi:ubiquinone/menaquinone biosynthesis C-methylase UbiE
MKMEAISAFNRCAEEYDKWYYKEQGSLIFESEVKAIEALAPQGIGIEVGVGTGVFSSRLGVFLGVDPALRMIKIAKSRGVNVVQALGELLPIKSEGLDYVLFVFTICFLRDTQASLREAWRVLKFGANLIIGFIPRNSKWGKLYLKKKTDGHRFYKHANFYTLDEVKEILKREGFITIKSSAALLQEAETVRKVEEPSTDVSGHDFICIKAMKTRGGEP